MRDREVGGRLVRMKVMGVTVSEKGIWILAASFSLAMSGCVAEPDSREPGDLKVEVWSQVNGGSLTRKNKLVEYGDEVLLHAVVEKGGKRYSQCPRAIEDGLAMPLSQLGVDLEFEWFKVETHRSLYCTRGGFEQFLSDAGLPQKMAWYFFDKLELDSPRYAAKGFGGGGASAIPDMSPEHANGLRWKGRAVGTMRFKVVASSGGRRFESHGEDDLQSGVFHRKNRVHRISVKADTGNEVLDVGFAHGNLPYYYGSDSLRWEWYGADCGKFVSAVYSRVVDPDFGYLGTGKLIRKPARAVIDGVDGAGVYTWKGARIEYGKHVRAGDIVVINPSPHHTGLIGLDQNGNGFLDRKDPVLHTSRRAPEYQPIGETSLGVPDERLKILRVRH